MEAREQSVVGSIPPEAAHFSLEKSCIGCCCVVLCCFVLLSRLIHVIILYVNGQGQYVTTYMYMYNVQCTCMNDTVISTANVLA